MNEVKNIPFIIFFKSMNHSGTIIHIDLKQVILLIIN